MNFLTRLFTRTHKESGVGAIHYPDRILIETHHQLKSGQWIRSNTLSFVKSEISDQELGELVVRHLDLSQDRVREISRSRYQKIQQEYKHITGLKSIKAQMKDARNVHISRKNGLLVFEPTINGGSSGPGRGYSFIQDKISRIESSNNPAKIGAHLRTCWGQCEWLDHGSDN
ncbi:MAG: hypothetical protein EP338_12390 [Bacteroidetes bacterium]|nr:MAG: hypothetical protein EP338_12390 [Bacteroidota bacterium]